MTTVQTLGRGPEIQAEVTSWRESFSQPRNRTAYLRAAPSSYWPLMPCSRRTTQSTAFPAVCLPRQREYAIHQTTHGVTSMAGMRFGNGLRVRVAAVGATISLPSLRRRNAARSELRRILSSPGALPLRGDPPGAGWAVLWSSLLRSLPLMAVWNQIPFGQPPVSGGSSGVELGRRRVGPDEDCHYLAGRPVVCGQKGARLQEGRRFGRARSCRSTVSDRVLS